MTDELSFQCPRGPEAGGPFTEAFSGKAHWCADDTCSYCGSLSEKRFIECVEAGGEVGPTDKNYKVYLRPAPDGEPFKQTYRNCPRDSQCQGPDDCTHWTTRTIDQAKFYFQHLSPDGQRRFVRLLNAKGVKIGIPGHFYVLPFFCSRESGAA
jgi:hypothetical protein